MFSYLAETKAYIILVQCCLEGPFHLLVSELSVGPDQPAWTSRCLLVTDAANCHSLLCVWRGGWGAGAPRRKWAEVKDCSLSRGIPKEGRIHQKSSHWGNKIQDANHVQRLSDSVVWSPPLKQSTCLKYSGRSPSPQAVKCALELEIILRAGLAAVKLVQGGSLFVCRLRQLW